MQKVIISEIHAWASKEGCSLDEIARRSGVSISLLKNSGSVLTGNEAIDLENFRQAWEAKEGLGAKPSQAEPDPFEGQTPASPPPIQEELREEEALAAGAVPWTGELVADRAHTPPPVPTEDDLPQDAEATPATPAAAPATTQGRANRTNKTAKADSQLPRSKNATQPAADPVRQEEDGFDRVEMAVKIRDLNSVSGRNNLEIGRSFAVAKRKLKHGEFGKFVEIDTRMSRSFVNKAINVAHLLADREFVDSTNLPWEALTLLGAAKKLPDGVRAELLDLLLGADFPPLKEFKELLTKAKSASGANTVVQKVSLETDAPDDELGSLLEQFFADKQRLAAATALPPQAAAKRFKAKLDAIHAASKQTVAG